MQVADLKFDLEKMKKRNRKQYLPITPTVLPLHCIYCSIYTCYTPTPILCIQPILFILPEYTLRLYPYSILTLSPTHSPPLPLFSLPLLLTGDPQKVVDYINCRLTRLARWRDVLTMSDTGEPDAFDDVSVYICVCVVYACICVEVYTNTLYIHVYMVIDV